MPVESRPWGFKSSAEHAARSGFATCNGPCLLILGQAPDLRSAALPLPPASQRSLGICASAPGGAERLGKGGQPLDMSPMRPLQCSLVCASQRQASRHLGCPGGSLYQIYQNMAMRTAKRLAAPTDLRATDTLTPEAMQKVRGRCRKEWADMDEAGRSAYKAMYTARLAERRVASAATSTASPAPTSAQQPDTCAGHWQVGAERFVVHPKFVQEVFAQGARLPSSEEVP